MLINDKHLLYVHTVCIYCTNWLKVILYQEQIARQLAVIHHENKHELASLRFLKLNLEYQNMKMGRKTYERILFFFHGTVLHQHHAIGYHSCFYS